MDSTTSDTVLATLITTHIVASLNDSLANPECGKGVTQAATGAALTLLLQDTAVAMWEIR